MSAQDGSTSFSVLDRNEKVRLVVLVNEDGMPAIRFIDSAGKISREIKPRRRNELFARHPLRLEYEAVWRTVPVHLGARHPYSRRPDSRTRASLVKTNDRKNLAPASDDPGAHEVVDSRLLRPVPTGGGCGSAGGAAQVPAASDAGSTYGGRFSGGGDFRGAEGCFRRP